MDQNSQNVVWINYSRTADLPKVLMLFLSSPWTIYYKMHTLFIERVLIILR